MTLPNDLLDRIQYEAASKFPTSEVARELLIEGASLLWLVLAEDVQMSQEESPENN